MPPDFARLVSLACHDLRTPLATVQGFAKTLIRVDVEPDKSARYLGMIDEASEELAALTDRLSLAARIEAFVEAGASKFVVLPFDEPPGVAFADHLAVVAEALLPLQT